VLDDDPLHIDDNHASAHIHANAHAQTTWVPDTIMNTFSYAYCSADGKENRTNTTV
jgi:hypothetical protein